MSYNIKYRISYKRLSGTYTTIDILQKGFSGGITELLAGIDPLEITIQGNVDNIYDPSIGSGAVLRLITPPQTLDEFFTTDPQEFIVKCYYGDSGENLFWQGFISSNIFNESYSSKFTPVEIQCNDGIAVLNDLPYMIDVTGNTYYSGFATIGQVLSNIFSKLNISFSTIISNSDLLIADYTTNPFLYLTVNNENYVDENGKAMSCRQVLNSIFQPLSLILTLQADKICLTDPINLHKTNHGKSYATSPLYGAYETPISVGGYADVKDGGLRWFADVRRDIVQPYNSIDLKYDPYNFTNAKYDFNASGNANNNSTYGTYNDGEITYRIYPDTTMKDWSISGILKFQGIQKITTGSTTSEGNIDYYIKESVGNTGWYIYNFPYSNIKQDENLKVDITMDVYVNTKHVSNLWSKAATTVVNEIQIPIYFKVGNQWYGGGNQWSTTMNYAILKVRTADTRMIQKYERNGWWLWRHTDVINIDDSEVNDSWTDCTLTVNMQTSGNLITGGCTIYIPAGLSILSCTPTAAQASIKNVLLKNVEITATNANHTPIANNVINTNATLYNNANVKKSPLEITLTNGCGNYGASKSAFSTTQQAIPGINIIGLARSGSTTYYDTAKLLAQNLISQYSTPRFMLSGKLDIKNYGLGIMNTLIKDTNYINAKAFYIISGVYSDYYESLEAEMIEITTTRDTIN